MGGQRWTLTNPNGNGIFDRSVAIGEASELTEGDGDEDGAGDGASGAQGKKRRAKRQKVIAHNASVVSYLANIDVRDAGGWCYSQRDKVVSYGFHAHAGHARLEFGSWLLEKDNLRRATGVALAVGRKRLPPKFRCFPRMSGQVLRDKVFHSMSLCQAMWPYEIARDPHLTGIGICYDGTNVSHNHIQAGVMTFIFHRPNKNATRLAASSMSNQRKAVRWCTRTP